MKKQVFLLLTAAFAALCFTTTPKNNLKKDVGEAIRLTKDVVCYAKKNNIAAGEFESKLNEDARFKSKSAKLSRHIVKMFKKYTYKQIMQEVNTSNPACVGCIGACWSQYYRCYDQTGDPYGNCVLQRSICLNNCCIWGPCACDPE